MKTAYPKIVLTLRQEQEPEIYYGEPTGKTRWLAEAQDSHHPIRNVLGRGYTRAAAVARATPDNICP
ncbi:MAG: hypothetical protein LBK99_12670 [Opitutaceae bacterium]|jgi:hypothetical protein|nr:hypothetical protein [Opitutaceae bacterium]